MILSNFYKKISYDTIVDFEVIILIAQTNYLVYNLEEIGWRALFPTAPFSCVFFLNWIQIENWIGIAKAIMIRDKEEGKLELLL